MRIIFVDDLPASIERFAKSFQGECGIEMAGIFDDSLKALRYAETTQLDAAFLDIDMPHMDGLELSDRLRALQPGIIIIFVTAHTESTVEAMRKKADGVIFKPYDQTDIDDALTRARLLLPRTKKRVRIQTFGRFDVFIDGKLAIFPRSKAKELLALCVARNGGSVSAEQAIDLLWPDYTGSVSNCVNYRCTIKYLLDFLAEHGVENILKRNTKVCYLVPEEVECDFFDLLSGNPSAKIAFQNEFMSEYDWSENYVPLLEAQMNL